MAHLVETMAYVGQTPWHGLGNQLTEHQPLEVWAKQAGLDWSIEQTPVRYLTGGASHLGEIKAFDDKQVLFRSDTKSPLSVVSNRYKVVQPEAILEFYRDLTEVSGFELETAGVLKGGRKIWALARTGQSTTLKGKDTTNGYVLLATACDGSMATTAQFTSVRVVCNNTLTVALDDQSHAIKVPHSTVFDAQAVKAQMGLSVSQWDEFMYRMKTLSNRKVSPHDVKYYLDATFANPKELVSSKANEHTKSQVLALFEGGGMGSNLASANGTAFGLLNAVTQFVDHEKRARTIDHRLDSAWFGPGANLKQKALNEAMLLVA